MLNFKVLFIKFIVHSSLFYYKEVFMNYILSLSIVSLLFIGCTTTNQQTIPGKQSISYDKYVLNNVRNADYTKPYANIENIYQNLNGAIVAVADQLLVSNVSKNKNTDIILTSFVDLNKFNKTTTFGRLISESMFNELHVRKFKVTDFRGQDAVSVNADGEFHITRDIDKLKNTIADVKHVVVGTYSKFENDTILVNARILDSISGEIISTARVIYSPIDCSLFDLCPGKNINIVTDNCSKVSCPTQQCKDGICDNSTLY